MLFKILHGDDSRISTDITPFHEGYCYVTHNGYMYVDMNVGTVDEPDNQRIKLNAANAETLCGKSLDELKTELVAQDIVVLSEAQSYTDAALETATTQDAVVLHEAQTYTDSQINDVILQRLETLEKIINNSPLVDDFEGVGTLDAGSILDFVPADVTIIDPGTII